MKNTHRSLVSTSWALASLLCTLTLTSAVAQNTTKLRVTNPQRAQELVAGGARLIADYGSFQILEAPTTVAKSAAAQADVSSADEMNVIHLNAADLDTTTARVKALRAARAPFTGKRLHLVQFAGPIKPEWRDELEQRGARIVTHIPNNAYLIYGDSATLASIQSWAGTAAPVQWEGAFADEHKIHPRAKNADANGQPRDVGTDTFAIQLVEDDGVNAATLDVIGQHQLAPAKSDYKLLGYRTIIVQLPAGQIATIAAQPDVVSIHPYFKHRKYDERQSQIMAGNLTGNAPTGPGYLTWLAGKGFTQSQFDASGFVVDVTDSGIDNGTAAPGHFALYKQGNPAGTSRVAYNRLEGSPNSGSTLSGCDGHGNLNSHIIGGYSAMPTNSATHADSSGYEYGLGVCPFVRLGSSVIFDPTNYTSPDFPNLQSRAYNSGARVSGNSWGSDTAGAYDIDSQTYDALVRDAQPTGAAFSTAGNQQMVIVFAAGNAGPSTQTVGSPGTAKNVITVGAAENVRAFGGSDGSGVADSSANSANDIVDFSSRGPCADGRYKPDLVAPGTHVTGGVGQSTLTTNGTGSAISCYNGEGVSGGVGGANFFPSGQQFYTASSGTSHSTPGIAGACALLRQYFINSSLAAPSPAMTKAYLVNSARYMTGIYANDTLPSQNQGMGHVNLGTAFDTTARILRDQTAATKFTASGQARAVTGVVADNTKPFRITLAWTDAPGNTAGGSYNNNLDLIVTVGGNTYKGNVFSGANSTTGGSADARNNVESVCLPAGVTGSFIVKVVATDINSDGVPNDADPIDQDFALVIYNGTETNASVIHAPSATLTSESCVGANGVADPGETVTVDLALQNIGSLDASNVVATLLTSGGVTAPTGPQTFSFLSSNGTPVALPFTFTATGVCGSNLQATFALTNNGVSLGTTTFTFPLGQMVPVWSENFDSVSTPSLPAGWSTTAGGGPSPWATTSTQSDSAPNAAHSTDATTTGSNALTSATITLPSGTSQLTFRHHYDLETGFDGGVLEMKTGAGAFTDILTAGGSFKSGGYDLTLDSGNALGARSAWSGNNGTFSTVVVNLPASAAGQNVQFRWRCGTDSGTSASGWWIDSIAIQTPSCCGDVVAPFIITQPQSLSVPSNAPAEFKVVSGGSSPIGYQWYFNSNAVSGATATNYFIPNVAPTNVGFYHVIITNANGSVTSSVVSLTLATPPVITTNPASLTILAGSTANFAVGATSTAPLAFQWQCNATNIPSATTSNLSIAGVTTNNNGSYTVIITNVAGAITSTPALLTVTSLPPAAVVISQIYGGGGNTGASYQRDYVELFNRSGSAINMTGMSVQYASSSGTSWTPIALTGTLQSNGYYLVALGSSGGIGAALPPAQVTNALNISATDGKVALVNGTSALSGSNPVGSSTVADFVGYGSANAFEGAAAPSGSASLAIFRAGNGATDTDNNSADFSTGTPNPRTNAAPPVASVVDLGISKSHLLTFTQGDSNRTYTIVVTNLGTAAATGTVSVVDVLPAGLTATAISGSGWTPNLGTLTATRSDALAAGASYPAITITVDVATNAALLVTNTATVSGGADTNTVNNTAIDSTSINASGGGGGVTYSNVYTGLLAGWDVSGQSAYGVSPLAPSTNAANITIAGLTRGAGITLGGTAAARTWGGNGLNTASASSAISANDFATWAISANPGYYVSFSSISRLDYKISSSGPTSGVLQYQVGSGGYIDLTNLTFSSTSGVSLGPIDLSTIAALQNVASNSAITFRLVLYGASNSGGNWYLFDLGISSAPDLVIEGGLAVPVVIPSAPPAVAPTIASPTYTNNVFQFQLTGTTASNYVVQVSTNLTGTNWVPILTNPAPFTFGETNNLGTQPRFFRARVQP